MRKRETENKMAMFLDRLVTIDDLEQFKIELLQEFRGLAKDSSTKSNQKWLKTNEVRKILGISAGKLLTLRVNGTLPYTKIGGVIYYDSDDLQKMFSSRKFQHPA
jgi:hypothetical protein